MYKRALVVDDEPAICDLIQKVLRSAGLEALTLTRSADAPGLLEEGKFDLVSWTCTCRLPTASNLRGRCVVRSRTA